MVWLRLFATLCACCAALLAKCNLCLFKIMNMNLQTFSSQAGKWCIRGSRTGVGQGERGARPEREAELSFFEYLNRMWGPIDAITWLGMPA